MGVKGKQSISYIYSRRALLYLPDPRLVELVEWLRRVLMVREVRGSIPYSGHFRVDHFRNVQHNTKVPISYKAVLEYDSTT
jgi:hypothetical protein